MQNKINESELRKDFEEFYWRMSDKLYFCNDISPIFGGKLAFTPKTKCKTS